MKILAFVFLVLFTFNSFGQVKEASNFNAEKNVIYFLDSVRINKNQMFFDPNKIAAIDVVKKENLGQHGGEIYMTSKNPKNFNFLTLVDIAKIYAKSTSRPVLFMLDNKILKDDISTYKIDADYILNVEVLKWTEISSLKNSMSDFTIISINPKTKENLVKANAIYIKGTKAITDSPN